MHDGVKEHTVTRNTIVHVMHDGVKEHTVTRNTIVM